MGGRGETLPVVGWRHGAGALLLVAPREWGGLPLVRCYVGGGEGCQWGYCGTEKFFQ